MKKISIAILALVVALVSCKKTPEVNLKYVDVERDLITVGTTTATVQCDYDYIATLKKAFFYYGEGANEADMNTAEMRVVQNTLYVDLTGLRANTTYSYFYEFHNGFNSMRTALKTFKTETSPAGVTMPTVVTATVTEIAANSAKGGGEVTNDGGAQVTERGICWSTHANPTLSDNHVAAGEGTGAFTALMNGLEANTTYHVRAYATNEAGTAYGLDKEFTTLSSGGDGGDHEWIDLGLPSGLLWATCNVGANSPEESGDYFAWGETEPKSLYDWSTYQYCVGDDHTFTKYCSESTYGLNGFVDDLTILQLSDDAARVNWGGDWRTATIEEWNELFENTSSSWTTLDGIHGRLFTGSNGNTIFLPASGIYWVNTLQNEGINGYYWSSSKDVFTPSASNSGFSADDTYNDDNARCFGMPIRPVRKTNTPTPPGNAPEGAINGLFTINENGDQVYFSQGNLQYQASTNTWRFAEHQWDYVGGVELQTDIEFGNVYENGIKCDNAFRSPTYDGWIDLYAWATSGFNHGSVCYQPWSTSYQPEDFYAYGDWTNNLYDDDGRADWGYNAIANGESQENIWRTLTAEEWSFIMNQRSTFSDLRYVFAIVNDVKGIIILPDDWDSSCYYFITYNTTFENNVVSLDDWNNVLQIRGAAFLPNSGQSGYTDYWYGAISQYWSASSTDHPTDAKSLSFLDGSLTPEEDCMSRANCFAVRLVQDANFQK